MNTTDELTRDCQGYDPVTGTYHLHHDWKTNQSLIETIVFAVAAVTGRPPTEIEPLHDVIDPDALAVLFRPISDENPRADGFVSFTFDGQTVTVRATGEIVIDVPDVVEPEAPSRRSLLATAVGATLGVQRLAIVRGWETVRRTLSLQRNLLGWC